MRKILPDSLSRTVPLWCCVMNRLALKYRIEMKNMEKTFSSPSSSSTNSSNHNDNIDNDNENHDWDIQLYTPSNLISPDEHTIMLNTINTHVNILYKSGGIVNINQFVNTLMIQPIRPIWITNGRILHDTIMSTTMTSTTTTSIVDKFSIIVCCNPSYYHKDNDELELQQSNNNCSNSSSMNNYYYYSPGAGDDDATWANNLTPQLFWSNSNTLLDVSATEDEIDDRIISIVNTWQQQHQQQQQHSSNNRNNVKEDNDHNDEDNVYGCSTTTTTTTTMAANENNNHNANRIGNTNIWIGSRTSGRPPQCWLEYDVILNVTMDEYPTMKQSIIDEMVVRQQRRQRQQQQLLSQEEEGVDCNYASSSSSSSSLSNNCCYYLQLPIKEGKKDKIELERWLSVGMTYILYHIQQDPTTRILIHCAQGRDRSVAVCIAFVVLFCIHGASSSSSLSSSSLTYPLRLDEEFINTLSLEHILDENNVNNDDNNDDKLYYASGLKQSLVDRLLLVNGRDLFLLWLHKHKHKQQQQLCCVSGTATTTDMSINIPFATKDSLRYTLHLIQQDRTIADTTRSTMQKLNRYFMSSPIYI
jgi:tRNA A64-2'-O-ribosylphosphate transferase